MSAQHTDADDAAERAIIAAFDETPPPGRFSGDARSPTKTLLVFAAMFAPFALAPYLVVRRRLAGLTQQLDDLAGANAALARELRAATRDLAQRADAHAGDRRADRETHDLAHGPADLHRIEGLERRSELGEAAHRGERTRARAGRGSLAR